MIHFSFIFSLNLLGFGLSVLGLVGTIATFVPILLLSYFQSTSLKGSFFSNLYQSLCFILLIYLYFLCVYNILGVITLVSGWMTILLATVVNARMVYAKNSNITHNSTFNS